MNSKHGMLMLILLVMLMLICLLLMLICVMCVFLLLSIHHLHKYPSLNRACYNQALRDMNISMNHIPCLQYVEARFSEE